MTTNIEVKDRPHLTITSDSPVVDCGNDGGGARVFRVNKPYNIDPPLSENPAHFKGSIASINGLDFGGNGEGNEIMIVEQPDVRQPGVEEPEYVEILIR